MDRKDHHREELKPEEGPTKEPQAPNRYQRAAGGHTITVTLSGGWELHQGQDESAKLVAEGETLDARSIAAALANVGAASLAEELADDPYFTQMAWLEMAKPFGAEG